MHTATRQRQMVERMYQLGMSVSHDRVRDVEDILANSVCNRYLEDDTVCPVNLRKGLFSVGALDNIDHNPTSVTAEGSFHATDISIFQFPTSENEGTSRPPLNLSAKSSSPRYSLPDKYVVVPAVECNTAKLQMPSVDLAGSETDLEAERALQIEWINTVIPLLHKEMLEKGDFIDWAAYHASVVTPPANPPALSALLPLFFEKASTMAMVKHGMGIQKQLTHFS